LGFLGHYAVSILPNKVDLLLLQKYRHIIWDWNGTLLDDVWLCVEILNEMLHRRNRPPVTREKYMRQFSFPVRDFYERIDFDFSAESYGAVACEYIERYEQCCRQCRLQDHAYDVLRHYHESGRIQSILSVYHQESLEEILDFFKLRSFFSVISGGDDHHAHGKIEQGIRLVSESGISPDQAVLIGDTIHDYEVARKAGMDCILFAGGHYEEQRLRSCGVPVVESLGQLVET
jgi:phosphoglycolate phosphatase